MSAWFDQPQSRFLVAAIVTLTFAAIVIKWAGSLLRGQLGAGVLRRAGDFRAGTTASVPPALVREALEKGLVTPARLAGMSETERQFLFASLGNKLGGGGPAVPVPALPLPSPLMPTDDVESARLAAAFAREGPKVHCPGCGTRLELPAFPPLVSTCRQCGTRSALRNDEGDRYVLNVTPPKA
jgi:hypothetical protein